MTFGYPHMRVFLLTFNGERKFFLDFLDTRPEILNWFAVLDQAIVVVSRSDVATLSHVLHDGLPSYFFIFAEIDITRVNGWMNMEAWEFIKVPKSSGRWP